MPGHGLVGGGIQEGGDAHSYLLFGTAKKEKRTGHHSRIRLRGLNSLGGGDRTMETAQRIWERVPAPGNCPTNAAQRNVGGGDIWISYQRGDMVNEVRERVVDIIGQEAKIPVHSARKKGEADPSSKEKHEKLSNLRSTLVKCEARSRSRTGSQDCRSSSSACEMRVFGLPEQVSGENGWTRNGVGMCVLRRLNK